jgi:hypothetical protein
LIKALALLLSLFVAAPAWAVVDPVGWWKFDAGAGSTAVDSGSGTTDCSLINTPTWIAGQIGTDALSFARASSEYADCTTDAALNLTGPMTISAWINPTTLPTSNGEFFVIAEKGYNGGTDIEQFFLRFGHASGVPILQFGSYAASTDHFAQYIYGGAITTGNWYHVVGLFNGTEYKIYVDAVEVATLSDATAPQASGAKFIIAGADIAGNIERFFDGGLDDVRLYDRAITTIEIGEMFTQTEGGAAPGTFFTRRRF